MPRPIFPNNRALVSKAGKQIDTLRALNLLDNDEKELIYLRLIPQRLFSYLNIDKQTLRGADGAKRVKIIAPEGFGFARIEVRLHPDDKRTVFFLDIADTHFHQMELAFCIIRDPFSPTFEVDLNSDGDDNCFCSNGRNIEEEIRAMNAGLYPNQTNHGLRMFGEFLKLFERFVDSMLMSIITAQPLTYDNAVRYQKHFGFDYLCGRRLMCEIDKEFQEGGELWRLLDGSTPFRQRGVEKSVIGRSWAIHDGILLDVKENLLLKQPWEEIELYKNIGAVSSALPISDKAPE